MIAKGSRHSKAYSSVVALAVLFIGFLTPIQSASAATKVVTPTTLTTCTVGGVTTVVASGTFTCSDGVTAANVWTSSAGLVTADRPYLGTLRYCINNSTAVITTLTDGSASITCKSTETQVSWTRTWGAPAVPVIRNVSVTGSTSAMVAYTDSTANNGSQIVKYVVSSIPAGSSAIHIGAGSPTMKMSGLQPDTDYSFKVCATNAAGTTCTTTSPTVHTYPLAPAFTLNPTSETGVYGTAITGYTITQTGGNSTVYPTTYSISPVIPNGFSFNTSTGLLTGTPTGTQAPIVYTVTGTNVSGSGFATFTLTVIKANQTITFPAISGTKTFGDTAFNISATASSNLPVSFASTTPGICSVSGATVTIVGAGNCSITASQAGDANYNAAANVVQSFNIAKADQTVTLPLIVDTTYGASTFDLAATSSTGLPITYTATGACSVFGSTVTVLAAGNCLITATQGGNDNYNPSSASQSFNIGKATLLVTADNQSKVYGAGDPALTFTYSGLVNNDTAAGVFTGTLSRVAGENVGDYAITQGTLGAGGNYAISFTGGTLSITAKAITVTALNASKVYGGVDPLSFGYSAPGLVGSDTLSGTLSRAPGESVGSYAITGTLSNSNYVVTLINGTFTITPKAITVTANNASKVYGTADPASFTYTVPLGSLINSDVLSGSLSRTSGETVGTYPINGVLTNSNYSVSVVPGVFTITQANVTLSFDCTFGGSSIQSFDGKEFKFCRVNSGLVSGTVTYTSGNTNIFTVSGDGSGPIGHPVAVGTTTLTVTFTPTDLVDYVSGQSITLTVHIVSKYSPNNGNDYQWTGYQAL